MYPLSCLRELRKETRRKFVNSGIVLIKQLLESDVEELSKTGVSKQIITETKIKFIRAQTYFTKKLFRCSQYFKFKTPYNLFQDLFQNT